MVASQSHITGQALYFPGPPEYICGPRTVLPSMEGKGSVQHAFSAAPTVLWQGASLLESPGVKEKVFLHGLS